MISVLPCRRPMAHLLSAKRWISPRRLAGSMRRRLQSRRGVFVEGSGQPRPLGDVRRAASVSGPEGRGLHWRSFTAALDAVALSPDEEACAATGANAAFACVRALVERLMPLSSPDLAYAPNNRESSP